MGRNAFTIDDQVKILKDRGLIIHDEEKAREHLLDIGYYRLGFYWYYFQDENTHIFEERVSLNDIIALYYFDFDLKNILAKAIYRIEVHFRTQVVYHVSNFYHDDNIWFTDGSKVNHYILKELNNIYFIIKSNTKVLQKHHSKYPSDTFAPAWKTFEFLTFGQIYKIYYNLKERSLKEKIASVYGFRDNALLDNFFRAIINIRNICSHNAVLYDYNQPIGIKRIPNIYYRNKSRFNTNLNASLRLILFILSKISLNRANDLEQELKELVHQSRRNSFVNRMINDKIKFDI